MAFYNCYLKYAMIRIIVFIHLVEQSSVKYERSSLNFLAVGSVEIRVSFKHRQDLIKNYFFTIYCYNLKKSF